MSQMKEALRRRNVGITDVVAEPITSGERLVLYRNQSS